MISIIYSTHKDSEYNNKFKQHLLHTVGVKDVQILEYVNHNQYSLSEVYNSGITESIYDIVVCCHNDIKLEKNWGKKLLSDFSNNLEFGIIGKAGSCYFPESGVYWERMNQTMVGQVYHHPPGKNKWLSKYCPKFPFLIPVVTIDGLFISFDKTKIKHKFDETIGKFHFYDHLFCIPNYIDGVKIGVSSSFEITHESVGQPNQEFWESKEKFLKKWGNHLPLDCKPSDVFIPQTKEKPIKNFGKVAIIISNPSKTDLLIKCIESFYMYCDSDLFQIFIDIDNSSLEEQNLIEDKVKKFKNITFIDNFSKTNHDVEKKYLDDNFEFLLFCEEGVELRSNVIHGMLKTFKENLKTGTVGCRLHYPNNIVYHNGISLIMKTSSKSFFVDYLMKNTYYKFLLGTGEIIANDFKLIMVKKSTFLKYEKSNQSINLDHKNILFNLHLIKNGYINYCNYDYVAYYDDSQTTIMNNGELQVINDSNKPIYSFIKENFEKLKKYIIMIN